MTSQAYQGNALVPQTLLNPEEALKGLLELISVKDKDYAKIFTLVLN